MNSVKIIDSHTGGEPTRLVVEGFPDLGGGSVADQVGVFRCRFDRWRSAVINEPRGSDVLVGAVLVPSQVAGCYAGLIFFNNVGMLGMCGHGTIGVVATLAHEGIIKPGEVRFETCVGVVTALLHEDGRVSIRNVPSYRERKNLRVSVPGVGNVVGDVAWGGNWFFLVSDHSLSLELNNLEALTDFSWRVRQAVNAAGFPEVDHVELFADSSDGQADSKNFVLCPGKAYDRSPCGTGTSAKLACLAADGKLSEGEVWRQESIIGTQFEGRYEKVDGKVIPTITGTAFVTSHATLCLNPLDPFCWGIEVNNLIEAES